MQLKEKLQGDGSIQRDLALLKSMFRLEKEYGYKRCNYS